MPYEVSFSKNVAPVDTEQYINECCFGGDVVLDELLPSLRSGYGDVEANQEDWGWFAWFGKNRVKLAVDIFTDEGTRNQFRIHLTSRLPRLFLGERVEDTPELEELRELVVSKLQEWSVSGLTAVRTDTKYIPEK